MKNYLFTIFGIIVTYIISVVFMVTQVTAKFTSVLFYLSPLIGFLFIYIVFKNLEKLVKFNFGEIYIGIILLVFLFLGFYVAFVMHYCGGALFTNVKFLQAYKQISATNWVKFMTLTPYIYFLIGSFLGWVAYAIEKKQK